MSKDSKLFLGVTFGTLILFVMLLNVNAIFMAWLMGASAFFSILSFIISLVRDKQIKELQKHHKQKMLELKYQLLYGGDKHEIEETHDGLTYQEWLDEREPMDPCYE
jgi:hypothetical protein